MELSRFKKVFGEPSKVQRWTTFPMVVHQNATTRTDLVPRIVNSKTRFVFVPKLKLVALVNGNKTKNPCEWWHARRNVSVHLRENYGRRRQSVHKCWGFCSRDETRKAHNLRWFQYWSHLSRLNRARYARWQFLHWPSHTLPHLFRRFCCSHSFLTAVVPEGLLRSNCVSFDAFQPLESN